MSESTSDTDVDDIGDDWAAAMSEQVEAEEKGEVPTQARPAAQEAVVEEAEVAAEVTADSAPDKAAFDLDAGQPAKSETSNDNYKKADLTDLSETPMMSNGEEPNLDVILDIPVTLSMEIGRTEIPINHLMQLNQGSVVELDRLAGEPMDVLINGTLIAHGEVVVVNEKFGIRLTDVISPAERVKKLR